MRGVHKGACDVPDIIFKKNFFLIHLDMKSNRVRSDGFETREHVLCVTFLRWIFM